MTYQTGDRVKVRLDDDTTWREAIILHRHGGQYAVEMILTGLVFTVRADRVREVNR